MKSTLVVIALHLLLLYPLFHYEKPVKRSPPPLRMHTVQLQAVQPKKSEVAVIKEEPQKVVEEPKPVEKPQPIEKPKTLEKSKPIEKPTPIEEPKPIEKPKPVAQKPKPVAQKPVEKPKPVAQKPKPVEKPKPALQKPTSVQKERNELLAMMEESLQGLEKTQVKPSKVAAPAKIGTLKSESITEATYQQTLVDYLQSLLHFPEDGQVRVKLTVTREGKITNITVVQASSKQNEHYVCDRLKPLSLPAFGNNFKGENTHTFSILLTSK